MSKSKVTSEIQREINRYRQFMLENEYADKTALGYSTYVSRFLSWNERNKTHSLQQSIKNFLDEQHKSSPTVFKEYRAALYLYYKMIAGESFPKRPTMERNQEIEAVVNRFYDYSVNIKRIKHNSVQREIATIRSFLEHMAADASCSLENITAHNIREFVISHFAHLKDSSKGREITTIRNFFRFQKFEGVQVHESIFLLPLSPAVWKNAAFPKTMDEEVFNKLSEIPDTSTPTGKRDRCIILLFTELALRCSEVSILTIDDFNWREGYVTIRNTKNRSNRNLPLSEKLVHALVEYIKNVRPQTSDRTLLVKFKRNCGEPMGSSQIRGVVRRIYAKSDTAINETGTHILRRTAGSKIYNAGNSLKMTADILGHESLDSTVFYVKADIHGLRQVAAAWPCATGEAGVHDAK